MKTISSVAVASFWALLASCPQASADDLSASASPDWTGFYIGASAGAAWNDLSGNSTYSTPGNPSFGTWNSLGMDSRDVGFTGGGLAGYNLQLERVVLGVEADINYLGADAFKERNPNIEYTSVDVEAPWYGSLRARAGFAIDDFLIYGTGGLAYGRIEAGSKVLDGFTRRPYFSGSGSDLNLGWTVGAGAEYAVSPTITVGAEYLYTDLGSLKVEYSAKADRHHSAKVDAAVHFGEVRGTLKFKF